MMYHCIYHTPAPFDDMLLSSDSEILTELRFIQACSQPAGSSACESNDLPIFQESCRWLDIYFSGKQPDFTPPYRMEKLTPFRKAVADIMLSIPFGELVTYGDIAARLARQQGRQKMSAQAVGGAVGWNPICLIIPCHRVIGAGNRLTGYGGGMKNKIALLRLEGHRMHFGDEDDYQHRGAD